MADYRDASRMVSSDNHGKNQVATLRVVSLAVVLKGLTMAGTLFLVLGSGLSYFTQGIIIAAVSATITGAFTVLAAVLAVRFTKPTHKDITDIKRKLNANRRDDDA
jgi:hypothetical protein